MARLIDWGLGEVEGLGHKGKRFTSLHSCSCRFREHWGLLCRHMLRLYFTLNAKVSSVPLILIASHWLKSHWQPVLMQLSEAGMECANLRRAAERAASVRSRGSRQDATVSGTHARELSNHEIRVKADVLVCLHLAKGQRGKAKVRLIN